MGLSDTAFVIVDTETTGVRPATERIIEIGAVRMVGDEIVETYSHLINPDRYIPSRITQITGISNQMVYEEPHIDRILPDFMEFLGDDIFVAHNLSFDLGFLNAELARLALPPLQNKTLCTLRLARRLLRGLRSKGLSALTAFYGIEVNGRHRALGDAMATAEVLQHLIKRLQYDIGVEEADDVLKFQFSTYGSKKGTPKNLKTIKEQILPALPESPGVYFMRDKRKQVIYVGKAKNLKSRVKSYFNAIEGHETRIRNLVEQVKHITWQEYDAELEALLEESRQIKKLKPRFNKAQKFYRNRPFIKLSVNEEFPRVSLHTYLVEDGAEYFGPISSRRQGELIVDLINQFFLLRECDDSTFKRNTTCLYQDLKRCKAPCKRSESTEWYSGEVEKVRGFLKGEDGDVIVSKLEDAMRAAAQERDYEMAAYFRDHKVLVEQLLEKQRCIAVPVLEHNAVVIDQSINDDHCRLLFIRYGRLEETLKCKLPFSKEQKATVKDKITQYFQISESESTDESPKRYFKAEIEDIRLLAHWLYVNRGASVKVDWQPGKTVSSMLTEVLAATKT